MNLTSIIDWGNRMNINMNWKQDGFTVYALNEQGVNDFSFHVQGNGRSGHDPKKLQKVVSIASAAPEMYRALRNVVSSPYDKLGDIVQVALTQTEVDYIRTAIAKADGE